MSLTMLTALSPLDGRYAAKVDALRAQFSEYGLIRRRLQVEIEWLKALAAEPHFAEIPSFSPATVAELDRLVAEFGPEQPSCLERAGMQFRWRTQTGTGEYPMCPQSWHYPGCETEYKLYHFP